MGEVKQDEAEWSQQHPAPQRLLEQRADGSEPGRGALGEPKRQRALALFWFLYAVAGGRTRRWKSPLPLPYPSALEGGFSRQQEKSYLPAPSPLPD